MNCTVAPEPTAVLESEMLFTPLTAVGAFTSANVAKLLAVVMVLIWFTPKSSYTVLYPYRKSNVHTRPAGMLPLMAMLKPVVWLVITRLVIEPVAVIIG